MYEDYRQQNKAKPLHFRLNNLEIPAKTCLEKTGCMVTHLILKSVINVSHHMKEASFDLALSLWVQYKDSLVWSTFVWSKEAPKEASSEFMYKSAIWSRLLQSSGSRLIAVCLTVWDFTSHGFRKPELSLKKALRLYREQRTGLIRRSLHSQTEARGKDFSWCGLTLFITQLGKRMKNKRNKTEVRLYSLSPVDSFCQEWHDISLYLQ